jgi:CCR4-NOT transcription complex subunit 2
MHPPSLKGEHLSKFQVETLFYMFYSLPKDLLQSFAACELYRRDWKYHEELRIWLKPRTPQELMQSHPSVQFVFFDVTNWESRLFTTAFRGNLSNGLLTEEDVRVKSLSQHAPQMPPSVHQQQQQQQQQLQSQLQGQQLLQQQNVLNSNLS